MELQPIETAPKDGSRIVLYMRPLRHQVTPLLADGFWCQTGWVWPYVYREPTHWTHLPQPPIE